LLHFTGLLVVAIFLDLKNNIFMHLLQSDSILIHTAGVYLKNVLTRAILVL